MPSSFIQVPPNSTGAKTRTRTRTQGADTVHETGVFQTAPPTHYVLANSVAFASAKSHLSIYNAAGSGVVVAVRKLFAINLQTGAVTGAVNQMNIARFSAVHSAGTLITPMSMDSSNPAIPAGVTCRTGGTVTDVTVAYPMMVVTEENTGVLTAPTSFIVAATNWQPEGNETQELRLREGEGYNVRQVGASVIGTYAWLAVITVDEP